MVQGRSLTVWLVTVPPLAPGILVVSGGISGGSDMISNVGMAWIVWGFIAVAVAVGIWKKKHNKGDKDN